MSKFNIKLCRVYEPLISKQDVWLLIDRLWPRGLKKETLSVDAWLKKITPSPSLQKWFNHDPGKWLSLPINS